MAGVIIALLVAGFVLVILEIFLPGGVVGTIGVLMLLAGSLLCFQAYGTGVGTTVLLGCLVGAALIIFLGYKMIRRSRFSKTIFLESAESGEEGFFATDTALKALVGETGVAESDLRPAGIATFNEHRVSVVTEGDYIQAGERVRVREVESSRVVVERAD